MPQHDDPNETRHADLPLFAPRLRELSHATDPGTSVRAAAKMLSTGNLGALQHAALAMVRAYPGRTPAELGEIEHRGCKAPCAGVEWHRLRLHRRLSEVEKAEKVYRRGERDGCLLYWPTDRK